MLGAQGNDELLVSLLLAGLVQDTHVGLATVEGLGSLTETAGKTVVHESELQNTLEGVQNRHGALGGICGDFDFLGDLGGVVLFYVRLYMKQKGYMLAWCPALNFEGFLEPPPSYGPSRFGRRRRFIIARDSGVPSWWFFFGVVRPRRDRKMIVFGVRRKVAYN